MVAMVATSPAERITELERELQKTSQENRMLREEITWFETLLRLPPSTISPSEQKTVYALHKAAQGRVPDFFKVDTRALSESVGQSPGTFLRNTRTLAENLGVVEKRTEDVWYSNGVNEDGSDKRDKYTHLYVKPLELLDYPRLYTPQVERNHGGKRENAGRKPKCRSCQSERLAITEITRYRCLNCHDVWYEQGEEVLPESANNQDEKVDATNSESSLAEDSPANNQDENENPLAEVQVDTLLTTKEDDQLETKYPVTPPPVASSLSFLDWHYPLHGFTLEDWLQKRIGHGEIIHATGSVDDKKRAKYLPIRVNGIVYNLAAYIRGDLQHIYGSRPALADGTTYLLGFDNEKPELDGQRLVWQQQLAAAGIPSICWLRRPGRWHLEVYVDRPVDRKAFYAHLVEACPGLLSIPEAFPIGSDQNTGGSDRADFPYSWPLWYRTRNVVNECAAEVMFPLAQVPMISTGIESDRERLTWLISQVIIPDALIPERIVTQASSEATKPGGALLDTRSPKYSSSSSDGLGKAVIAEFNAAHTWEEIASLCGGLHRDRFCSPAHREDTPSVVIRGNYASDYGRTPSGRVETRDKFGWWCLARGINQDEELKRRIAERQVYA